MAFSAAIIAMLVAGVVVLVIWVATGLFHPWLYVGLGIVLMAMFIWLQHARAKRNSHKNTPTT
jgi:fatty acid desaturase